MLELHQLWHDTFMVNDCLLKNDGTGSAPIVVRNTDCVPRCSRRVYAVKVNLIHAKELVVTVLKGWMTHTR